MEVQSKWGGPLTGVVALGAILEIGLAIVCWRYVTVLPVDAYSGFLWIMAFVGGAAPVVLVWLGLRELRRTPLPDHVETRYVNRLIAGAVGTYSVLLSVLLLFKYALERLR